MKFKRVVDALLIVLALIAGSSACTSTQPASSQQSATSAMPATPLASESPAANGYDFGYGTYYVATRRNVPPDWGDAKAWYAHAQAAGYEVGNTPKRGAIAWTDRGPYGQVAIVDDVNGNGKKVTISEMYGTEHGWNKVTTKIVDSTLYRYIYIF